MARRFTVHLLGSGMPSFYVADLGDLSFTLGLSGWTANDWSTAGNFDLMAPGHGGRRRDQARVFDALKETLARVAGGAGRAAGAGPGHGRSGALGAYTQAGRAIWDLNKNVLPGRAS